jgi:hypothetical protein
MLNKIGLFFEKSTPSAGPGSVTFHLINGLGKLGVEVVPNKVVEGATGCLQKVNGIEDLPVDTLIGPNISVLPSHDPGIFGKFQKMLVPSQWVKDLYITDMPSLTDKLHVWPVGINVPDFKHMTKTFDFVIYFKGRGEDELAVVTAVLDSLGCSYIVVHYGSYTRASLEHACLNARFGAIMLNGTESQGIATLEILATDTPILVLDKTVWNGHPASSVPYFNTNCGIVQNLGYISHRHKMDITQAVKTMCAMEFSPREYVLNNFTDTICAQKYLDLLEGV